MIKAVIIQPACSNRGFSECSYRDFPDFLLLGTARNVREGIHLIRDRRPNLVFLDVELPDGSGFEVLEATKDLSYEKIILSQETRYIFKAFRFDVADYLVKPLRPEALRTSIHKLIFAKGGTRIQKMYNEKFCGQHSLESIFLPTAQGEVMVAAKDVLRIEDSGSGTTVVLENRAAIHCLRSIRQMAKRLAYSQFFRLSSDLIVRLRADLSLICEGDECICVFPDGQAFKVPPQKINVLRDRLRDLDTRDL